MQKVKNIYYNLTKESLYKNSMYLMLSTIVSAVLGYFFWIINARMFSPQEVGIGTTLISVMSLLTSFCLLGLGGSLVKYLPSSIDKTDKINTSFTLIGLTSILVSIFYVVFIDNFSPKLTFVRENILFLVIFILFILANSLNTISNNIFVAFRSSIYVFIKSIVLSLSKLVFPFIFAGLGAYGVFMGVGIPTTISFLISIFLLATKFGVVPIPTIKKKIVKTMLRFSAANYIMGLTSTLPSMILPILITNNIGPEFSAYFYMDMMIAGFLYIIPTATSQSLFAEGVNEEKEIPVLLKKAVKIIALLLVPATLGVFVFGKFVLLTFGEDYSREGLVLLRLLSLSVLFISINHIGSAILYIKNKIKEALALNIVNTLSILGLSLLFINYGLYGIGWAWVIGNAVTCIYYLPAFVKNKLI